jgi:hypothetical protein
MLFCSENYLSKGEQEGGATAITSGPQKGTTALSQSRSLNTYKKTKSF